MLVSDTATFGSEDLRSIVTRATGVIKEHPLFRRLRAKCARITVRDMSEPNTLSYRERAEQCERMALGVKDPEARQKFVELARHWRALAKATDQLEPERQTLPE
jgi:hypothetical protein